MRFLVIGIDRATGAALLLTETPVADLEAVTDALRQALATSEALDPAAYDVTIVDLDAGTPVVVLPIPTTASEPSADSVSTGRIETAQADEPEPIVVDEQAAGEPAWERVPEPATAPEPQPAFEPEVAVELGEDVFAAIAEPASPSSSEEQDLLEALRRAADSLVQQGVEVPQPIESEVSEEISVAEPMGVIDAPDHLVADDMPPAAADQEPVVADALSDLEPIRPVIMGEYPEAIVETSAAPSDGIVPEPAAPQPDAPIETKSYEPAGDLELAAYTCNDCVYADTCPKAGESTPAECGTFQWRSF